ncbi:MAG TPA: hypothetical protein VJL28_12805 [Gemmatimonadaceae bacterium]|nr:hypothetical protein [Gemmatimonadaceae bacterium]
MRLNTRWTSRAAGYALVVTLAPAATACYDFPSYVPPRCTGNVADVCVKGRDLAAFIATELSDAVASGSGLGGSSGTLGGFGKTTLEVRTRAISGAFPSAEQPAAQSTAPRRSELNIVSQRLTPVTATFGLGLWRGYSEGDVHVLGADLLLSATHMPSLSSGSLSLNDSWAVGAGVRLGVLGETSRLPGIALTWMNHGLPAVSLGRITFGPPGGAAGSAELRDLRLKSQNWRGTVSKRFGRFGASVGFGQNAIDGSVDVLGVWSGAASISGTERYSLRGNRDQLFVGGSYDLRWARIVTEAGRVSGQGVTPLLNSFTGPASNDARHYFSVGLRVGR